MVGTIYWTIIFLLFDACSSCSNCQQCYHNLWCDKCNQGFYLNQYTFSCIECTKPCTTCSTSGTQCTTCVDAANQMPPTCECSNNQYMDTTTYQCINCLKNCAVCLSPSTCSTCAYGYYNLGTSCQPCIKPCQQCSVSGNNCTQCVDSTNQSTPNCSCSSSIQYMDNTSYNCLSCVSPCLTCSSASSCLSCIDNYFLSGTSCFPCTKPCANCSGNAAYCSTCIDINQTPPQCNCNSGYLINLTTKLCDICTFPCATCQTTVTYCLNCVSTYTYDSITHTCKCLSNQYEQFGTPKTCQNCLSPCLTCQTTNNNCNSCIIGLNRHLQTNQCICDDGFYDDGIQCKNCILPCIKCTSQTICNTCNDPLQTIPNCQCPDKYLMNSITKQCNPCTFPCQTCEFSAFHCLTCASTYTYQPITSTCTCQISEFEQYGSPKICQSCISPCLTCFSSSTSCKSCLHGLNRHLVMETNKCNCDIGYYDDGSPLCKSCAPCYYCTSASNCFCLEQQYLDDSFQCKYCQSPCYDCITNGTTCLSCIDHHYQIGSSCYPCQWPCNTCVDYETKCTSCAENDQSLVNNTCIYLTCVSNCIKCTDAQNCEICEDGFLNSNQNCIQCNKNCLTCIDQTDNCQSCKPKEQLIENRCYCDSNTIKLSTDTCIKCEYPCLVCENQDQCLQCASIIRLFLRNDNQCVCEEGSTWQNSQCQVLCPQFCFQCLDGTCLECQENYSLNNNQCIQIKTCGNGQLDQQEFCDDGNDTPNDGCYKCEVEENWQCNTEIPSQCNYFEPPYLLVSYLNQTALVQYIDLKFSSEVWTDSNKNLSDNLIITIPSISQENYIIIIYPIKEVYINLSYGHYQISVEIQQQLQQKPILSIQIEQNLFNEYGLPLENKKAEIQLNIPKYLNPEQKKMAEKVQNTNENIIYGLGAISFLSLFMGEAAVFQEILKLLQYQSYLKFINLDYPENLQTFFKSTNIVSVSAIVKYTNLNYYLTKYSLKQGPLKTDGKFAFYSYDADLITNLSCQFIQFSVLVIVGVSTRFLQGKFYNQINNNLFIKWMNDLYNDYSAKNFIFGSLKLLDSIIKSIFKVAKQFSKQGLRALFIINSQDLIFKAMIYLHYMQFDSIRNIIQAALAFTIVISYITLIFYALWKNNFIFTVETKEKLQIQYDVIILARQTLFITLIVFGQPNQVIQTVLITFINIICFILLKRKKQFGNFFKFISQVNEILIIFFMIICFFFFNDLTSYFTQEFKTTIGWAQIGILCISLVLEASKFVITKCQGLIKYIKKKINENRKKQEVDPIKQFWALPM